MNIIFFRQQDAKCLYLFPKVGILLNVILHKFQYLILLYYERVLLVYKNELLQLIEYKRKELIIIVSQYGLNSSQTIQYSQELDSLLNVYNKK